MSLKGLSQCIWVGLKIHSPAAFAVGDASLVPGCRASDGDLICGEVVVVCTPEDATDWIGSSGAMRVASRGTYKPLELFCVKTPTIRRGTVQ